MKNRNRFLTVVLTLAFLLPLARVSGQISDSVIASHIKVTAELVSHYVWRGSMATGSPTPNFQPTLAYTSKMFEIGVWGSTDFAGTYKEVDPYLSVTGGPIKVTLTDYNWNLYRASYFNYKANETGHMLEGSVGYTGPASFPLSISWNTMFYGFDKKDTTGTDKTLKQAYSTYIELGYAYGPASFFFGFSPWGSYYTAYRNEFEVVNIGVTLTKALKITKDYSLPLRSTFIVNPSGGYNRADYVHLVFGITF
jgi:hypothetical protein